MKNIEVLVVGELNVDIILDHIEGIPAIGKEILANKMNITLGSSSAILASNLSILGAQTAFVGKIGKDNFADIVLNAFKEKKVNTEHIIVDSQLKTGLTVVLNYDNDRANVTYPGAMEELRAKDITTKILKKAKHLHISSVFLQPGLIKNVVDVFKKAKELGLTTSLDPQWDPDEKWNLDLKNLLPHIDIFMPNAAEFINLTGCNDLQKGIEQIKSFANVVVIKDGENGAVLWDKHKTIKGSAFLNQNVADCIGAGDSFNAGFISEYVKNSSLEHCMEVGNITGALNTTASGGTTAFKSLEFVKEQAKTIFSYNYH